MEKITKKEPEKPSAKKDKLENKDKKNTDKKPAKQTDIGKHEFEEDRSTEIRMKPQPFDKAKQPVREHDSDGL